MDEESKELIEKFRRLCPAHQEEVMDRLDWTLLAETAVKRQYGLLPETAAADEERGAYRFLSTSSALSDTLHCSKRDIRT
jgi:hypothetical protein